MQAYDSSLFTPPAPLARVILRYPETGAVASDVLMLLDTGADITLLPQSSVDQLGIKVDQKEGYELMGFDGSISVARVVQLDLLFLRRTFKGRFLLINQEWGLLGRDISITCRCCLMARVWFGMSDERRSDKARLTSGRSGGLISLHSKDNHLKTPLNRSVQVQQTTYGS